MIFKIVIRWFKNIWLFKEKINNTQITLLKKIYTFIFTHYCRDFGSYIGLKAKIKGEITLPHGLHGIFISNGAEIGKGCVMFHQVTIGSNTIPDSKGKGAPIIGENCYIGAGAKVIGNVVIGDNVRVGANCVVFKDVPSNSVVVTDAPKIITKEKKLDNSFVKNS